MALGEIGGFPAFADDDESHRRVGLFKFLQAVHEDAGAVVETQAPADAGLLKNVLGGAFQRGSLLFLDVLQLPGEREVGLRAEAAAEIGDQRGLELPEFGDIQGFDIRAECAPPAKRRNRRRSVRIAGTVEAEKDFGHERRLFRAPRQGGFGRLPAAAGYRQPVSWERV